MSTASGDDEFEPYTAATVTVTAATAFGEIELPDGSYSIVYEMRDAMDNYACLLYTSLWCPYLFRNYFYYSIAIYRIESKWDDYCMYGWSRYS